MTAELGLNLAGVERVFELEDMLAAMSRKVQALDGVRPSSRPRSNGLRRCASSFGLRSCHTCAAVR